jgi:hypothetical protein
MCYSGLTEKNVYACGVMWPNIKNKSLIARMHSSARCAGYPSDSSRAERQQFRTRPAGGGPLHYDFAVDRLRHLRHCPRPPRGRPCARFGAGPGENPPPPGPGAVPHRHRPWAAVAGPGAVPRRGLLHPGRGTRLRHRTRSPLRSGAGAARTAVRAGPCGPLTAPHVAD